ncbi:MAG TPA: DUF4410 domain-containing protein [Chthoniobacterales bacterium]
MYVTNARVGTSGRAASIDTKDFASAGIHMLSCGVGAHNPRAIYIRPFCIDNATVKGDVAHSDGELPIRKSLIPVSFATTLKEQLEKIAPARVLKDDETPRVGWLVDGEFMNVDGGSPAARFLLGHFGVGRSYMLLHVRVTDVETGTIAYEFDVYGGSELQGKLGTLRAAGLGKASEFDLVNAAERIYLALEPNAFRYGVRNDIALR